MKEVKRKVEYLDIKLLKPHPKNPRIIKDNQFEKLCQSIKDNEDYFETRPILCNPQYIVFAGNMRLKASLEVGLLEVPVIVMDISEDKQNEIMIRDNRQNGEWDWDILMDNFDLPDLKDFGFEDWEFGTEEAIEVPEVDESKFNDWADSYEKGTVKQIVLYFPGEEFADIIKRMTDIMVHAGIKDNTEVFKLILGNYETNNMKVANESN
jgi:hypothetical protein